MASDGANIDKTEELRSGFKIAVLSSAITLAGVLATNVTAWISSAQTTHSSEKLSCISRLDKQEDYARIKSDALITSLAALATGSTSQDFKEKKAGYVEALSKAGYSLMLLNNSELGVKSGELTDWMTVHVLDYKTLQKTEFNKDEYESLVTAWKNSYYEYLAELDSRRKGC